MEKTTTVGIDLGIPVALRTVQFIRVATGTPAKRKL